MFVVIWQKDKEEWKILENISVFDASVWKIYKYLLYTQNLMKWK